MEELSGVVEALDELTVDTTVPQNVRAKLALIIQSLNEESQDVAMKVNQVLDDLEEISNDANIPSYTRTQIWNISCMLEMIH